MMRWYMFRLERVDAVRVANRAVRARNVGFIRRRTYALTRSRPSTKRAGFPESRLVNRSFNTSYTLTSLQDY